MIHRVDDKLRLEATRYRLVFACPDCVHGGAAEEGCSLRFPNTMHEEPSLEGRSEVVFCKAFELG